jgi:hypothetical protein
MRRHGISEERKDEWRRLALRYVRDNQGTDPEVYVVAGAIAQRLNHDKNGTIFSIKDIDELFEGYVRRGILRKVVSRGVTNNPRLYRVHSERIAEISEILDDVR